MTCRRETSTEQPIRNGTAVLMFDYRSGPPDRPSTQHVERHHSRHTPAQLFDLVVDVEQYPNFVPWVISAQSYPPSRQDDVDRIDHGNRLHSQAIHYRSYAG